MMNMNYYSEKASQISAALQILALVQPALMALFQMAETLLPPGTGGQKMDFVKTAIHNVLADIPDLQGKFEACWNTLQGIIEAVLTVAKAGNLIAAHVPAQVPVATPTPA